MCGIIAVVRRRRTPERVDGAGLVSALEAAGRTVSVGVAGLIDGDVLSVATEQVVGVDNALRGLNGVAALVADLELVSGVESAVGRLSARVAAIDAELATEDLTPAELERLSAALLPLKDAVWAIERDRLRAVAGVQHLAGPGAGAAALAAMLSVHQALSALDRLEVRGRDSAGLELVITRPALDFDDPVVNEQIELRNDPRFTSGAVRVHGGRVCFVYKAAAEIGELGDNTAALRSAIASDELLRRALGGTETEALVLGHTRWASIGVVSEPNAHPQVSDEVGRPSGALATAVLNGDVDNYADLSAASKLAILPEITTDAKVIPALWARRLERREEVAASFRETVAELEGSVAIAACTIDAPDRLFLALRGSGQALYVGLADDAFVVASEPYGVVEETPRYLRMDGETPQNPENPAASRGQVLELAAGRAGSLEGIRRWSYDGTETVPTSDEVVTAEVTTRDIDRGDYPHFLLKEINDAPVSFRKTLRGKLVETPEGYRVRLGSETIGEDLERRLRSGRIGRVFVIGQGTAAVAGQSLALRLAALVADTPLRVEAKLATELSGFDLRADMSDTLVIAVSQSGTTTDTNRTVDLVRSRGASVVAIVNRRNSDLVDKSDGVLYTADGRDVEMSVASTKAFYSQIAAGLLLAYGIAAHCTAGPLSDSPEAQRFLAALADLPDRMEETIATRSASAVAAQRFALSRRYWAIVGNGANLITARELRIKLSELCYKAIACDATEDKKHIDLSSEPMILVCAAGLMGSTADDVSKEVAIYKAHKAAPIVIAESGSPAAAVAGQVIPVPVTHPDLAFVLAAMAGHLFGYEAALAIDAQARVLREARSTLEAVSLGDDLEAVGRRLQEPAAAFNAGLRSGDYNGHLEAATAVRIAGLFRYATGLLPLDTYQLEFGKIGTPGVVLDDLTAALTVGIEELTRPVDAIKHQAKTVTVGISRSDESVLQVPLVRAVLDAGAPRDGLSYRTLKSLADLDPAVSEVVGHVRYGVDGADTEDPRATVLDKGGVAAGLASRLERDPRLRGTKHLVAREQELMVARGVRDGRVVCIVPEVKNGETTGLTLLHLVLPERLPAATMRGVLLGYRRRYPSLRDAVTETEEVFRDDLLGEQSVADLLMEPILDLARRWRT